MGNKEQDFINRYKNVQESIVKAMDKALERAIGNKVIDFEKCEGNYLDVYPLIGKEYKAIKNYIHNELGLTIKQLIEIMVDNKLSNKDFNVIPRTVEKILKDKMLNDIEIVIINKNLNDRGYGG